MAGYLSRSTSGFSAAGGASAKGLAAALAASALLMTAIPATPASAGTTGQWQFTGSMTTGHAGTNLVQLPDGRVLAISGQTSGGVFTSTAEIYDPGTGQWSPAGTLHDARMAFGQPSVLPDGDVLVAGGHDPNVVDYASAELYDPATNQWTLTGSLNTARRYDVQVELKNGEVLAATGSHGPPTCTRYLSSAELYDPATGRWTYTGSTQLPRESADAVLLADGRVLLAGGYTCLGSGDFYPVTTEIYDPATRQWSSAGDLPHGWMNGAMVRLPDGRVLLVDGTQDPTTHAPFAGADIFNPATDKWTAAASPHLARYGPAAMVLPDGRVLVSQGGQLQSEIYDPATNTWSLDATALGASDGGQTFLLPTGKVLLAGGVNSSGPATTAELYTPPPGSQTIRFTGPATGTYGGSATLTATGGGSGNPVVFSVDPSSTAGACAVSGSDGSTVAYAGTGSCVIDANQAGGNGYGPAPQVQRAITVSPAPLTIRASSATMTYGGKPPAITPGYSGFVAGDNPGSLTIQPTCSTTAASNSPLGDVQSSACAGASDPDYRISYVPGRVTVTLGNYVAMGDSYSSGEGDGAYTLNGNTNRHADRCHRSQNSYPKLLFEADPQSRHDHATYVACSGAETRDFLNKNHKYPVEGPQFGALKPNTNVVTFTVGGNDVGFAEVLQACAHVNLRFFRQQGYGCSKDKTLAGQVTARIAALEGIASAKTPEGYLIQSIPKLLSWIHRDAPQASIFVGGYPRLFGSSTKYFQADTNAPSKYVCVVGSPYLVPVKIDYTDAQWLNAEAGQLDKAIAAAVAKERARGMPVTYVSEVPGAFATHGMCDSSTLWFHQLGGKERLVNGKWTFIPDPGSFHPTRTGQKAGYEASFAGQ